MRNATRLISVFALLGTVICSCTRTEPPSTGSAPTAMHANKNDGHPFQSIEIKTEVLSKKVLGENMHVTGHIRPETGKEAEVSPRFEGRVLEVKVKQGDEVVPGQVLCLIDSHEISSLQAEVIEAKSKLHIAEAHEERERQVFDENLQRPKVLTEARTRHEQSKVHLHLAETEYKRVEGLHKEKIAAERDFIAAQAALAKARLEEKEALSELQREESLYKNRALLRRDLQLAEAETLRELQHLNTLKQRLELVGLSADNIKDILQESKIVSTLPIKARIRGLLTLVDTSVGEMVSPGKVIFTITDLSTVAVVADLPEVDLSGIKLGSPVRIKVAGYPDESFTATVEYISDTVSPETRTVAVRAILDNKLRKFKVNMSADIYLNAAPRAVLACPREAVAEMNGRKIVFVKEGSQFRERHVELGADTEQYYEVVSGLKEGEEVVTEGMLALKSELPHHR